VTHSRSQDATNESLFYKKGTGPYIISRKIYSNVPGVISTQSFVIFILGYIIMRLLQPPEISVQFDNVCMKFNVTSFKVLF
jgi:hypothetical protein